jgi:hypothetical protein
MKNKTTMQTTLTFHSVLNHTDIGRHFCNFLKNQNQEETWKFILASQLLEVLIQKQENEKRAKKQLQIILNTYFDSRARDKHFQLQKTKENEFLFSLISDSKFEKNLELLYAPIITLKNRHLPTYEFVEFPKFVETPEAQKLCKIYEKNKELVLPVLSKVFQYKDEDFEIPQLQERDFQFFKEIELEDKREWDQVLESENSKIYQSFQNYLPRISFLELPQCVNYEVDFECSFQEALCGVLHKYFEHDSISIFFKTVDYQKDYFVIDQYVQMPPKNVRVRRMICTLVYENGSVFGLIKPLKIPDLDFMKLCDLKFLRKGKEHIEKGIQEFLYFGFRFVKLREDKTRLIFNAIHQGISKKLGSPKTMISMKVKHDQKIYLDGIQSFKGKKISDFYKEFNEIKNGMPADPFAKMLLDLDLDQYESKEIKKEMIQVKEVKKQSSTTYIKIRHEKEFTIQESFMDRISKSLQHSETPIEGELMENVSKSLISSKESNGIGKKLNDFNMSDFANSERFMDLDTECLTDILEKVDVDPNEFQQFYDQLDPSALKF